MTIPGDIRSEGNINIDINLSDSTLRRWQFGEDGDLELPQDGGIVFDRADTTIRVGMGFHIASGEGISLDAIDQTAILTLSGAGNGPVNQTYNKTNNTLYTGNDNSSVTVENLGGTWFVFIDGDAKYTSNDLIGWALSTGPGPVPVGVLSNGYKSWGFSSTGELTLPEGAVVKNISGNLTIEGESYVIIDSANNGQIEIGRSSGVGAVILGSKSNGTNVVVDDLFVANGVYEFFSSLADATGVVTHNCANGHLFYHTSPDANWTVNLTNLLDTWNRATSVTIIIAQGATGYYPSAVQIAGVAQTINWQGNITPTPSTNRTDVVTFSIINNAGTYTVLGQLTGF